MNDRKFAFIICTNDEAILSECLTYLSYLAIPEGFEVETLTILEAQSMAAGYNEGMAATDAKYKIYLHQDVFLRFRDFLAEILAIFDSDPAIGMIGTIGAVKLPATGVQWDARRIGNFYRLEQILETDEVRVDLLTEGVKEVEAVDGLLIATQYDLPWREEVFDGWDFYDTAQCMEFRKAGYKIVAAGQKKAWCIHDSGVPTITEVYERYRRIFLASYPEFIPPKKRFLCCYTDVVNSQHIPWGLLELGHDVCMEANPVHIQDYDEQGKDEFAERLKAHRCDYVITFDLSPEIAQACYEEGIPYIAWAYDSPLKELNGWFALYPTTHAFCMDRRELATLKAEGKQHAHLEYMHLAGNVTRMNGLVITPEDEKKYSHDVSMVGNLYDMNYLEAFLRLLRRSPDVPEEKKERIAAGVKRFIEEMVCDWRRDGSVFHRLPADVVEAWSMISTDAEKSYNIPNRRYYEAVLAREITHRDRVRVLKELSKLYDVHLYTRSTNGIPAKVTVHGQVDPYVEAPKVFHLSKINLNISLRSIETGTPLRVFDVMSVGGFMMSNFQYELADLFVPDKEIVLYECMDELKDKVKYYLSHESKRQKIAVAGYQKVKKCYSYPVVLEKMIRIVDEARANAN